MPKLESLLTAKFYDYSSPAQLIIKLPLLLRNGPVAVYGFISQGSKRYVGFTRITIGTSTPAMHCFLSGMRSPAFVQTVEFAKIQGS